MSEPYILIAEDDAELRELLVKGLRRHDLDATGVGTGAGLLAGTEEWRPDALVVDVGLPDADGRDVCQALRARGANLPILFLTARDTRADRLSGFASGGTHLQRIDHRRIDRPRRDAVDADPSRPMVDSHRARQRDDRGL